MTILLSDPRVSAIPVLESGEPLIPLDASFGPARALVRQGLADRLLRAQAALPHGTALRVVEGHRTVARQREIIAAYTVEVCAARPGVSPSELDQLISRFVAPVAVAPHVAGAAVDLSLVGPDGIELDLGTPVDATPEESADRCYFAATDIGSTARAHRDLLAGVLGAAGLVNYPTEWWHWSFGDRYWALVTDSPTAQYGPVSLALSDGEAVAA